MEFKWLNESEIVKNDNRIEMLATAKSDFFCANVGEAICNAPYYYTEFAGDFVLKV